MNWNVNIYQEKKTWEPSAVLWMWYQQANWTDLWSFDISIKEQKFSVFILSDWILFDAKSNRPIKPLAYTDLEKMSWHTAIEQLLNSYLFDLDVLSRFPLLKGGLRMEKNFPLKIVGLQLWS